MILLMGEVAGGHLLALPILSSWP